MKTTAISLLLDRQQIMGYTKNESWAHEWCDMSPSRSLRRVERYDRPSDREEPPAPAPVPLIEPAVKKTHLHLLEVHFDGGCRPTNPGNRYGSFRLVHSKRVVFQNERIEFGRGTNNEAEFMALQAGLDFTLNWLSTSGRPAKDFQVRMVTDSMLVQGRVAGTDRAVKTEAQKRMAALTELTLQRLAKFGHHEIEWRRRDHNVAIFGH